MSWLKRVVDLLASTQSQRTASSETSNSGQAPVAQAPTARPPSRPLPPLKPALVPRQSAALFEVPVLEVRYFPVRDDGGTMRIDRAATGDVDAPLDRMRAHTANTTQEVLSALERGCSYHLYKDLSAQPSIRRHIVDTIEFLEPLPTWDKPNHNVPMTDYNAIMNRIDIAHWVARGVKEVWLWGYHGGVIDLWESNMAGPWGDVSNSDRDPHDLPVLDKTYTVYHYNYGRGPSEAVEDHMHQIEAVLREIDRTLFWDKFVGGHKGDRCGWAHYPPNGESDYDWRNPKTVLTDIEDWQPDSVGTQQLMNCDRWHSDSLTWFIYWMQNLPGKDNGLSYQGRPLTNWWTFIGDFDGAMSARMGLTE